MSEDLPIEALVALENFDSRSEGFDLSEVASAFASACKVLGELTVTQQHAVRAEAIAPNLRARPDHRSPWRTYFGPLASWTTADGKPVHLPDIAQASAATIAYWKERSTRVKHPLLRARYADLAWEFEREVIPANRSDARMADAALDAYLDAARLASGDLHDAFEAANRALMLALSLKNGSKRDVARAVILDLTRRAIASDGPWSQGYDALVTQRKSGLTDIEREQLVGAIEGLLARCSDGTKPGNFNPHCVQEAATRLAAHYRRTGRREDERRVRGVVGRALEHFANLGNALLATSVLNDAIAAYRGAGDDTSAERVRLLLVEKVQAANAEMHSLSHEVEITFEEISAFKATIVGDHPGRTLMRFATRFLTMTRKIGKLLKNKNDHGPLMAHMTITIMGSEHQVATLGSIEDDQKGRIIHQTGLM